ncbi:MAG: tRNA glutamyl-Q(34) synthetase GluQRS [Clostridia bacterium]|nr:tRNA glutamyl-Q(34) synthetase GluQRS [Clostridia bacterium]
MIKSEVVGRFAPTPSGRLHLGNLLCCLLSYLSARSQGGRFLLRIEDLDAPRCPKRLSDQCVQDLRFLGFDWDEAPLYQSERTQIYQKYFDGLDRLGLVYPCFCTRAQLHAAAAPNLGDHEPVYGRACASLTPEEIAERKKTRSPAMRLRVPDEVISFKDGHFGAVSENLACSSGDYIIRRSDGLFGYQLAVVIDDALSGVNEIVRGRDILFSTPRQMHLQRTLGFYTPSYFHIPLLMDANGRRLAKRDKDLDLTALSRVMTPEQILGMLAYSAGVIPENRPMSLDALVKAFDWKNVKKDDIRLAYDPQAAR